MSVSVVEWFANFGAVGIVIVLLLTGVLVTGKEHSRLEAENERLKDALAIERQRNNDLLTWASVGAQAMKAVATVAEEHSHDTPPHGIPAVPG